MLERQRGICYTVVYIGYMNPDIFGTANLSVSFHEAPVGNRTGTRYHVLVNGLAPFLFWVVVGIAIHVWTPHGQDSSFNINQIEAGRLISRLVHFSYILAGYSILKALQWLDMTALQALGIVSVLSLGISGWSIFRIGYHFKGSKLGWPLSFLVLSLPLVLEQAQGQEYQPFATAMMLLAWYFWIVRKSLPATSIAWATSVLANPANAFLFASFTSFSLLESGSEENVLRASIRVWLLSAVMVIAVWGPFGDELLFSKSWGVVPVMSKGFFSRVELLRGPSFLAYAVLANFFIFIFAVPFKRIYERLQEVKKSRVNRLPRRRVITAVLLVLMSASILSLTVGSATHGRYYTPLLLWAALLLLLGIVRLLPSADTDSVLTRWRWVGAIQLLFVVLAMALPYKYKAYARYSDYHHIADNYEGYVIANTGSLGFTGINRTEKRLRRVYNLDVRSDVDELRNMMTSGRIQQFILVYGIDVADRALLKKILPEEMTRKLGVSFSRAEDLLEHEGFSVKLEPFDGAESDNVFLARRAPHED